MLGKKDLTKEGKEFFEYLKEQSELKKLYIYLREQIRNSGD